MKLGYARTSTGDGRQKLDLQLDALRLAGVDADHIYTDQASGSKMDRPGLDACLKALREGDTLVVYRLDRLGRNTTGVVTLIEDLAGRGVAFHSTTEALDTSTPAGRLMLTLIAAFAQMERELIRERVMAGLEAARARGVSGGRKPKLTPTQKRALLSLVRASHRAPEDGSKRLTIAEIGAQFDVSPATVRRIVAADRGLTTAPQSGMS